MILNRIVVWMLRPGFGWVRVFGRGVTWKDTRRYPLLFSERRGYTKVLRLGPWVLWLLPR